jgi:hypothetical protein
MRPGGLDPTLDRSAPLRLLAALALSAAFHASVIAIVRAGVPNVPKRSAARIEARIEASAGLAAVAAPTAVAAPVAVWASAPVAAPSAPAAPKPATAPTVSPAGSGAPVPGPARATETLPDAQGAHAADTLPGADSVAGETANENHGGPQVPFTPDTTYYSVAALDRLPAPLSPPEVCYPHGARGEVTYELLIDETGAVNQASVVSVTPPGLATAAAAELCSAIRFSPARKAGRSVRSKVRLVVGTRAAG